MNSTLVSNITSNGLRFRTFKIKCLGLTLQNTADKTFFVTSMGKVVYELAVQNDEIVLVKKQSRYAFGRFLFGKLIEEKSDLEAVVEDENTIFIPQGQNDEDLYRDANGEVVVRQDVQHIVGVPHQVEEVDDDTTVITNLHTGISRTLSVIPELAIRTYHQLGGRLYYLNFLFQGKRKLPTLIDQLTGQPLCTFGWTTTSVNGRGFSAFTYQDVPMSDDNTLVFVTPV